MSSKPAKASKPAAGIPGISDRQTLRERARHNIEDGAITDSYSADRKVVIFLGDYVDRGPDSCGVVRYLAGLPAEVGAAEARRAAEGVQREQLRLLPGGLQPRVRVHRAGDREIADDLVVPVPVMRQRRPPVRARLGEDR